MALQDRIEMALQDRIDEIMKGLPPSLSSLKIPQDLYELNYLQHLPQDVDDVQNKFIELVDEVLGTSYSGKEVHRHGIVGRFLDDSGNNDLYRAWYRFMCIDTQYREWTQPAFAMTEPSKFVCVNKDNPKLIAYFRDKKLEQILVESELQKSVKNLIQVKNDQKRLDDFAKARYDENFPQGWHHYDEFKIINETTLRIKYKHGFGDYEYNESFDVDLTPYYRDEKLEKI
jgi:hypothetical protein